MGRVGRSQSVGPGRRRAPRAGPEDAGAVQATDGIAWPAANTPLGLTRLRTAHRRRNVGAAEGVARIRGALGEVQAGGPAAHGAIAVRMLASCSLTAVRWASFSTVPAM